MIKTHINRQCDLLEIAHSDNQGVNTSVLYVPLEEVAELIAQLELIRKETEL